MARAIDPGFLELPLPGSWRETDAGPEPAAVSHGDPAAPAKGALSRLRTLVSGHRTGDGGSGAPSGHATAS